MSEEELQPIGVTAQETEEEKQEEKQPQGREEQPQEIPTAEQQQKKKKKKKKKKHHKETSEPDDRDYTPWPLPEVEVVDANGSQFSKEGGLVTPGPPGYDSPKRKKPKRATVEPEMADRASRSDAQPRLPPADSNASMPLQMVRFFESADDVSPTGDDGAGGGGLAGGFLTDEQAETGGVRTRVHHASFMDMVEAAKDGRSQVLEEMMGPPQLQNFSGGGGAAGASGSGGGGRGKRSVQVDKRDANGWTMLHYAARNNHVNVCEVLLRRGASINVEGAEMMTPLHLAAKYKRAKGAKAAAAAAAASSLPTKEVPEPEKGDATSFSVSDPNRKSLRDDKDAVFFLLRNGADMTLKDFYGCTPLHYAAMKGNTEAARFLLSFEKRRRSHQSRQDKSASLYSTREAIWRITDNESMTPLHLACAHKEAAVVRLLIETETNDKDYLDMVENTGCTALHLACAEGDADICSYLLHAAEVVGAGFRQRYVNRRDMESNISLHYAVENENVEVAEMLIKRGA